MNHPFSAPLRDRTVGRVNFLSGNRQLSTWALKPIPLIRSCKSTCSFETNSADLLFSRMVSGRYVYLNSRPLFGGRSFCP